MSTAPTRCPYRATDPITTARPREDGWRCGLDADPPHTHTLYTSDGEDVLYAGRWVLPDMEAEGPTTPTPYTPTDEDIVGCWARAAERSGRPASVAEQEARGWLAARDARVRAEAVREAHQYAGERGSGNVYIDLLDFADREEARAASIEQEAQE